jgi:hypothetical protein
MSVGCTLLVQSTDITPIYQAPLEESLLRMSK